MERMNADEGIVVGENYIINISIQKMVLIISDIPLLPNKIMKIFELLIEMFVKSLSKYQDVLSPSNSICCYHQ